MRVLNSMQAAQELARLLGKPVLLLSGIHGWIDFQADDPTFADAEGVTRLLAAPYLGPQFHEQGAELVAPIPDTDDCLIVCESHEEMERLYALTYGDDGMTGRGRAARNAMGFPEYHGAHRIYALTIDEHGQLRSENT